MQHFKTVSNQKNGIMNFPKGIPPTLVVDKECAKCYVSVELFDSRFSDVHEAMKIIITDAPRKLKMYLDTLNTWI